MTWRVCLRRPAFVPLQPKTQNIGFRLASYFDLARIDLTPCRMALHFDYALRLRSNSVKTPGLYSYAGVVVHRSASLASMYSFMVRLSLSLIFQT